MVKTKGLGLVYLAIAIGAVMPVLGFISDFFRDHNPDAATLKYPVIETAIQDSLKGFVMFYFCCILLFQQTELPKPITKWRMAADGDPTCKQAEHLYG